MSRMSRFKRKKDEKIEAWNVANLLVVMPFFAEGMKECGGVKSENLLQGFKK